MTTTTVRTTVKVTNDGKMAAWAAALAPLVGTMCWLLLPPSWAFIAAGICATVTIGGALLFFSQKQYVHEVDTRP